MLNALAGAAVVLAQADADMQIDPDLAAAGAAAGVIGCVFSLLYLAVIVVSIAGVWKVFDKAGQPGWAAIVPIYNVIIVLQIVGKPTWWILMMLIPLVNLVVGIILTFELAKRFGRGAGTALGLIFLPFIFWPMLGFGSAQYQAPAPAA